MKIRIGYGFYTDGDYSLRNPEDFGCTAKETEIEGEFLDYVGEITLKTKRQGNVNMTRKYS